MGAIPRHDAGSESPSARPRWLRRNPRARGLPPGVARSEPSPGPRIPLAAGVRRPIRVLAPRMPHLPGLFLAALADRYVIGRELGQGGNAVVYLAHDRKHDRQVALNVLLPELAASVRTERFLREIHIAAKLTHPHIMPLHDSGEVHGFLYYVMPYVEGESLRQRLDREQQLPVADALQIARDVADALAYAHRQDIVHRDIKPENILLEAGHAVVADFGIARALSAASGQVVTTGGVAVGTAVYMSPEQGAGSRELDGRSDVYSLGCVLYEMLAGRAPFTGEIPQEILAQHALAS